METIKKITDVLFTIIKLGLGLFIFAGLLGIIIGMMNI